MRAFRSLDPELRGKDDSLELMKSLKNIVPLNLSSDEKVKYDQEAHRFHCSPAHKPNVRIDKWWGDNSTAFPALSKVAKAALSVFHGPLVEGSFNIMGNIIDAHSSRMAIETHDAFQTTQHFLRRQSNMNCLNPKLLPNLVNNMKNSASRYKVNRKSQPQNLQTKAQNRTQSKSKAIVMRARFLLNQDLSARKVALMKLVRKRKEKMQRSKVTTCI